MTTATKMSAQPIGLVLLSGVFALWLGLAAYYAFGLKHGVYDAFRMTFPFFSWPMLAIILGGWLYNRRHRGRVLLDCGPLPDRWMITLSLVSISLVVVMEILFPARGRVQSLGSLTWLSMWAMSVVQWSAWRLRITEGGVQCHSALLRWAEIAAWNWKKGGKLQITLKRRFQATHTVCIPARQREAVEELMAQHSATHVNA